MLPAAVSIGSCSESTSTCLHWDNCYLHLHSSFSAKWGNRFLYSCSTRSPAWTDSLWAGSSVFSVELEAVGTLICGYRRRVHAEHLNWTSGSVSSRNTSAQETTQRRFACDVFTHSRFTTSPVRDVFPWRTREDNSSITMSSCLYTLYYFGRK